MLYTRKGDTGTTKTFGCDQRVSKSSKIAEALGSLDEVNSFLGLIKVESKTFKNTVPGTDKGITLTDVVHEIQETLFIIQAEVAGYPKKLEAEKVKKIEKIIDDIETVLPPIKSFFISGGTKTAALFDVARTIARRAERRVVDAKEEGAEISAYALSFLNRLSSLLYALARFSNHVADIKEKPPKYR
ncbi:MAG: ATP:cob(I)alamin adenosyltransferase [Candidatus Taylorbacteria bacterium RIFCSPLOWO2_12_FULL_43_20]|uniref:Corrinoid adenosyltransferase n=1 Tax=Candidatus Taylorbacteria bacterium RIFCSPLOWO2_12_FULL_43_20 TaxID=1802332 RepID=A0A1G2NZM1_9BACT|nr:MAG: ATP:cob(I)alamin adenosyltransferase [Candidatus Taylorbacteria bacterium RIFCSPHIGHO2_02_FULL_43_55]OHA28104.1 MAG: ATP:cob(I)alamin adenosyltransferase [Candidatus Taylorbacteria bacterium RIFCSPHIGHO2_12_FULL_42_34]OHA32317.1 MAG: ATP:cob(I)alamin adenosyltransferase [Candidatus Taylorbacteria bacterium RIFCSPLOWO2_01_FULL_43_83]OHA37654.1 MAG: ATP:cob(I)alamin adenosyltransferase [Candidatus Taylorbacteria bacterium RIFCSPLOWO2_02_FULL_43_22b]OHA41545.1 MAG: ATP:cob(I)alamin adenosy